MAPSPELLERTSELKRQLLDLAESRRFRRETQDFLVQALGTKRARDQSEYAYAMDAILLGQRFSSGKTIVDHLLDEHPELPAAERDMLLSWRKGRRGVFRIDEIDDGAVVVYNLVDDLSYRAYSNVGPDFAKQIDIGWYLLTRLVPLGNDWLFSGGVIPMLPGQVDAAYGVALKMTETTPDVVFQNPKLLELGWELQRKERAWFIEFIGSDLFILPSGAAHRRMDDYMKWRMNEARDEGGRTVAKRYGGDVPIPKFGMPEATEDVATVGIIYDEVDGLHVFPELGLIEEAFADPSLIADPDHMEAVLGYLESPGIIPLPLRRLAERDPMNATVVFRAVLDDPDFIWERDGDALMRDFKDWYFLDSPTPSVNPMPDGLAAYQKRSALGKHVGRNEPCPCGSGKKYKHCHGRHAR